MRKSKTRQQMAKRKRTKGPNDLQNIHIKLTRTPLIILIICSCCSLSAWKPEYLRHNKMKSRHRKLTNHKLETSYLMILLIVSDARHIIHSKKQNQKQNN